MPELNDILEIIEKWFQEQVARDAIARNTEAYNQAVRAKADLRQRLTDQIGIVGFPPLPAKPAKEK
jgi:hypothetical protein